MTDVLLALILFVLVLNMILNSAWWRRAKANVPYMTKQGIHKITKKGKRG